MWQRDSSVIFNPKNLPVCWHTIIGKAIPQDESKVEKIKTLGKEEKPAEEEEEEKKGLFKKLKEKLPKLKKEEGEE